MTNSRHTVGHSPGPSPCGYDIPGLVADVAFLQRATRSDALSDVGEAEPPRSQVPPALGATRRNSSGSAAGEVAASHAPKDRPFRPPLRDPQLIRAMRSWPPFLQTPEGARFLAATW